MATTRKRTDRDPFPHSPRNIRLDAGLTPSQVAELMSIPVTAVRRLEAGRTNPTAKTLAFFYAACGRVDLVDGLMFFLTGAQQSDVVGIVAFREAAYGPATYPSPDTHAVSIPA